MLKKLFYKRKKPTSKISVLLNQNIFLDFVIQPDFFSAFLELITKNINDPNNKLHVNFNNDINQLVDAQIPLFENILAANFSAESLNGFLSEFKKNVKTKFEIPPVNIYFITYWFQILKKFNSEVVNSSLDIDTIKRFEGFYNKFENISRIEHERLSNENKV